MRILRLNRRTLMLRWTRPEEGWGIVLLQAALLINAALVIARSEWVEVSASLAAVAVCGGVLAYLLAKSSCPDVIAHITAAIFGLWAIGFQVLTDYPELGLSRRDRFAELIDRGQAWYRAASSGDQRDDAVLFALALALTFWLVSYLAVWTLFRRRWVLVAIVLPGLLVVVTLGFSPELGSVPLIVALLLSGMLSVLFFAYRRDQVWRRFRIPSAAGISRRVYRAGTVLVAAVLTMAWSLPTESANDAIIDLRDRAQGPMEAVSDWWFDAIPNLANGDGTTGDGYASFGDSFELGGGTNLSDEEAALLRGVQGPQYLVGVRYGVYTGRGWESDVAENFNPTWPDGTVYSPQMTFRPEQEVLLSDAVSGQTEPITGSITLLRPKSDLLFTLDAYLRSDLPTSVRLSWLQWDNEPFDLRAEDVPSDLRALAALLLSTRDYGAGNADSDGSPLPDDPEVAARIVAEREYLRGRAQETRWEISDSGDITLYVSGQVPVYDDLEAVFARGPISPGTTYTVTGLESEASQDVLRHAGSDYPEYVLDRYLAVPESVTERTRALAASLRERGTNNFDVARAIEREVRTQIEYSLDFDRPPSGRDVVDYALFESQIGDCDYFASAMAVLLRLADIPSRVVVGFHPSSLDPAGEAFVYRESDAHAWVEAFFPGYGWIPFEPTPSEPLREYGPNERAEPEPEDLPTSTPTPTPIGTPIPTEGAAPDASPTPTPPAPAINEATRTGSGGGGWRDWAPWGAVALLLGLSGMAWFAWTRPYRGLSPAGLLIYQTARFGKWLGVRRDPTMTPQEYAAELGKVVPAAEAPAQHVARLYAAERYGGESLSREQHRTGERALRHVRRSFFWSYIRRPTSTGRSNRGEQ